MEGAKLSLVGEGVELGSVDGTTVHLIVGVVEVSSFVGNIKSARGPVVIGAEVEESDGRSFGLLVIGAEVAEIVVLADDVNGGLVTGTLRGKVVPEERVLAKSKIETRKGTLTFFVVSGVGALLG